MKPFPPSQHIPLTDLGLWEKTRTRRTLLNLSLELTARCNNNCTHCYINLPCDDTFAIKNELGFSQLRPIIDEAVSLGCLWVDITGGEPLLRDDFSDIYLYLKKKGVLVSVFTNASLINQAHIDLFKIYPPRNIEISVYGITEKTHQKVTRNTLFKETCQGIERLIENKIPVNLKTTILAANHKELDKIKAFCKDRTRAPFRFDPFLHLRFDRDEKKNNQIQNQRLRVEQILCLEKNDPARLSALKSKCAAIKPKHPVSDDTPDSAARLFQCSAGVNSCYIGYDGIFKLCSALCHDLCVCDLKTSSLTHAWKTFAPKVMQKTTKQKSFKETCMDCPLLSFCMCCPAHADLETGKLDGHVQYFCDMAKQRFKQYKKDEQL